MYCTGMILCVHNFKYLTSFLERKKTKKPKKQQLIITFFPFYSKCVRKKMAILLFQNTVCTVC